MSKHVKTLLIVTIVSAILFGAVAVYAGNGSGGRSSSGRSGGQDSSQSTRAGETAKETCDEDCTNESYAVGAGTRSKNGAGGIIGEYADMIGSDLNSVHDVMRNSALTIWEVAEQEGNFETLKALELAKLDAHIAIETDPAVRAELTAHRDAVAAAATAAEMPEDYDGYENSDGARRGRNR